MASAFKGGDILVPRCKDMDKWAVIACDQYTSQPEYWQQVEELTKGKKSALNLILPEIYLEDENVDERIENIHKTMDEYLHSSDTFKEYKNAMIYVERIQSDGKLRQGIVGTVDLEEYDYHKGSKSLIRATEATVPQRIPPRMKIRENAPIELPHIIMLIDDEEKGVIEPLAEETENFQKLYDFDLMKNGGHIKGYLMDENTQGRIMGKLDELGDLDEFNVKYGVKETAPLVYAVGDGNHSLAAAKDYYENQKKLFANKDTRESLCRYALVEIVNLHSDALEFQAIHRIVKVKDTKAFFAKMTEVLEISKEKSLQEFTMCHMGKQEKYYIHKPSSNLTVGSVQNFLNEYAEDFGAKVDYIHGKDVVKELSKREDVLGFLFEDMDKHQLFAAVIQDGALPRKTFSMGHAQDKRYYVEAKRI